MSARRVRTRWLGAGGAVLLALLSGCSPTVAGTARPASGAAGSPPTVPVTGPRTGLLDPALPARLYPVPQNADLPTVTLANMKQHTLFMAGVPGTVTGSCSAFDAQARHLDCGTAYDGMAVSWRLLVAPVYADGGGMRQNDTAVPTTAVITARNVYGRFWNTFHTRSDRLRCDTIPQAAVVPLHDTPTGTLTTPYRCQYLGPADAAGHRAWVDMPIGYDDQDSFQVVFGPQ